MSINDITGDKLKSKVGDTDAYSEGYDRIFGKKKCSPCTGHEVESQKQEQCHCPVWTAGCCGSGNHDHSST